MNNLLTIIIPTLNEGINLPYCLESVSKLGANVVVVDSNSGDNTLDVARRFNCRIETGDWGSFSEKMNWASEFVVETPWVLRVDADEWLTDELVDEIRSKLAQIQDDVSAIAIKQRTIFLGKWIRHGGRYPKWHIRFWRKNQGAYAPLLLDEPLLVPGKIIRFKYDIVDESRKSLGQWIDKHNRYSDLAVIEEDVLLAGIDSSQSTTDSQASRLLWIKRNIYYQLPLFVRPFLYWGVRYFFLLGFLDGKQGFIFHTLHGFWYRLLIDAKIFEKRYLSKVN